MARKLFVVKATRLRGGTLADAETFTAYTDAAATVLADISLTSGGSAIAGSTFELDELGRAMIWGPTDDTSNLFLRSTLEPGLPVQQITADPDARLDTLEAGGSGIPATIFDAKGDIIAATAADAASRLAVGANDTVLTADSTAGTGLKWAAGAAHPNLATHDALGLATDAELATHAAAANPHSVYATDTDLSTHEADTTAIHGITDTSALATSSSVTSAVSTHAGLADPHTGYVLESLVDAKGDLIAASAADTVARLPVGADGTVLKAASGQATGLQWAAETAHPNLATHDSLGLATDAELSTHAAAADPHTGYVLESLLDAKGDIIAASAADTAARLAVGSDGQVLKAASGQATGLQWAAETAHPNLATHDSLGLATDAELAAHEADTTAIHGIADTSLLATLAVLPFRFKAGLCYGTPGTLVDGIPTSNDEMRAVPLFVSKTTTFDRIICNVTIAGEATSVIRMGIYSDTGDSYPNALLVGTAGIAANSTGNKEATISQSLTPGVYWLAMAFQLAATTRPTVVCVANGQSVLGVGSNTTFPLAGYVSFHQSSVSGALPSTFTSTVSTGTIAGKVVLRAA